MAPQPAGMPTGMQMRGMAPGGPPGQPPVVPGQPVGPPQQGGGGAMPAAGGPVKMSVVSTVAGGQSMKVNTPKGLMDVKVPDGIQPGQPFEFMVMASKAEA